ncbi:MAG: hypothetical protein KC917_12125 [Candidatus Omnitrophica bacterium]|nr:hypothetical protein [Candidatus Omnitrophota bacterium]MCA9417016.1 hypothetical protein [Candidatus Omnitrophota bacterium]MCA9434852.1 hypothetical protein [Candidatus Omnitrophota bacterium]MCB9768735.1 hypothetical protein [Candidatus Omnitrophota bacterium]
MSQKTTPFFVMLLVGLSLVAPSYAQFDSGSDGSDGALFIAGASGTVTMDVPEPDGIFNFTTVDIEAGATLQFNQNSLNTPVYMLATGGVTIAGIINVSGKSGTSSPPIGGLGGPGGYAGGIPGISGSPSGDGYGPGAGKRGNISNETGRASYTQKAGVPVGGGQRPNDGGIYGSPLLVPLVGGSGGGGTNGQPGTGGGGGGGACLIASDTEIFIASSGRIDAQGGGDSNNAGSGGSVRLVAPVVRGTGTIDVRGGGGGWGGTGRVRVDVIDRKQLQLIVTFVQAYSVGGFMQVFPDPLPRLDVTHVAGKDIPEGTTEAVLVTLPLNSSATQEVRVQGRDFVGLVPIRVVLTPDSGSSVIEDATIDMGSGNPSEVSLMMGFPVNTPVAVNAFTR